MSVREAQSRIDAREFAEWKQYYALEPFGATDLNVHMAMLIATLANAHRGEDTTPFEATEFMLGDVDDEVEKSPEEVFEALKMWAVASAKAKQ